VGIVRAPEIRPRIGYLPIGRLRTEELRGEHHRGLTIVRRLDADLQEIGPAWSQPEVLDAVSALRSAGMDALVVHVLEGMSAEQQVQAALASAVPTALWALPTNYSFSSAVSAIGALRERDARAELVVADAEPDSVVPRLQQFAWSAHALSRLRGCRIGALGGLFPNLSAAHYHAGILSDALGVQVVRIPLAQVKASLESPEFDEASLDRGVLALRRSCDASVEDDLLRRALRFHLAIGAIASAHRLAAVTLDCFTELIPLFGVNPCLGFADPDREYLIACEGDAVIGACMLMLQFLGAGEPWLGDVFSVRGDILTLVHCGGSSALCGSGPLRCARQTAPATVGSPTAMAMCVPSLEPGDVTLTRLHGRGCDRLHVARGEVVSCDTQERLSVRIRLSDPAGFLAAVCGNHYVVSRGDQRPGISLIGRWLRMEVSET
jgi:L-fucose isomerase-like protein